MSFLYCREFSAPIVSHNYLLLFPTDFKHAPALNNFTVCGMVQSYPSMKPGREVPLRKKRHSENKIVTEFVAHGTYAQEQEHPWHVSISYRENLNNEKSSVREDFCGGSLISKQVILTGIISHLRSKILYTDIHYFRGLQLPIAFTTWMVGNTEQILC